MSPQRRRLQTLIGHRGEICNVQYNYDASLIVTGSMDRSCKLWSSETGQCVASLTFAGVLIVTALSHPQRPHGRGARRQLQFYWRPGSQRVRRRHRAHLRHQDLCLHCCFGRPRERSVQGASAPRLCNAQGSPQVVFSPQGSRLLTASSDKTARLWDVASGKCVKVLEGHTDEVFAGAFNYDGDLILTCGKDNFCRLWR